MANNFTYYTPTKVLFGKGEQVHAAEEIKKAGGTRVLILYGGESAVRSGLIRQMKDVLDCAGIPHAELGGVVPNPLLEKVYEGIKLCQKEQVDFILAVGGGSVIDSAKAIAYGLAEADRDIWELYDHSRRANACFPIGVILTIAAAGSETSNSSVITNQKTGEKRAYDNDLSRPKFAVMNPEFTMTLPDYQTMSGCTDIMMHTMERYFTNGGNLEITDTIAEGLLRTVMKNAEILHSNPQSYNARAEVMWAGSLAHNGLTGCGNGSGDFSSHMLEHELGGMFNVTHGAGLAAVWGSWARYVYKSCLQRFVRYAVHVMGVDAAVNDEQTAIKGIEAMKDFYRRIGMPISLKELGIEPTDEQIHEMAERCAAACGGHNGSALVLYKKDMESIYRMAM